MRVSRNEMERSHKRIVDGAARLVRERGIERTSVAEVMSEAGMKHGGFYRHFKDKDSLVSAAVESAFQQSIRNIETRLEGRNAEAAVADYRVHYLSKGHVGHPGQGCPVAAVGIDVARGPEELKGVFGSGVRDVILKLAKGMPGPKQETRVRAAREFAMMVGAVIIARASGEETSRLMLSACRKSAKDG